MKSYRNMSIIEKINTKHNIKSFSWAFAYRSLLEAATFGGDYRNSIYSYPSK